MAKPRHRKKWHVQLSLDSQMLLLQVAFDSLPIVASILDYLELQELQMSQKEDHTQDERLPVAPGYVLITL